MKMDFDIGVIGSGFAGSLFAMVARRLGRSVVLVERGSHPRFAIGESSSPLANLLLEELAERYGLPRVRPLAKWGSWQRRYPEIGCGLKRGFTFYGHELGKSFAARPDRSDQLLVAASPRDEIADTHWYRSDFDHFLVRQAQAEGGEYLDRTGLRSVSWNGKRARLEGERRGERVCLHVRFLVDASGPRGFLQKALRLAETPFPAMPATQGLYTHFLDVRRLEEMGIFPSEESPPYPIDDAAVHHIFDGGWIWVLRFNNRVTSAGVAATARLAGELRFEEGAPAWDRLLDRLPTLREQFGNAQPLLPLVHAPRLSYRLERAAGPGWALLPSAAAFVDPLLSTGFPLTLLGIERLAGILEKEWDTPRFSSALAAYAEQTLFEADTAADLVSALYASFRDFPLFSALSMLYFAAASYAETARRLSRPHLAGSFLSGSHPVFGPAFRSCCELARRGKENGGLTPQERSALFEKLRETIEPFNIAGFMDPNRRNWYPVEADDLLDASHKLAASRREIEELLVRCGFFKEPAMEQAGLSGGKEHACP